MPGTDHAFAERLEKLAGTPLAAVHRIQLEHLQRLLSRVDQQPYTVARILLQRCEQRLSALESAASLESTQLNTQSKAPASRGAHSPILDLVAGLNRAASEQSQSSDRQSEFEQKLSQQEARLLGEAARSADAGQESLPSDQQARSMIGLRASAGIKLSRKRSAKRRTIQRTFSSRPKDPGPLNPQMLALKMLDEMQAASPDYLARMLEYIDTLAALADIPAAEKR